MTSIDNTLVEETIQVPFPVMGFNAKSANVLVLKSLELEFGYQADFLQTAGDYLTITISPNSEATHPTIIDNDCMFKFNLNNSDGGAATNDLGAMYLIKKWKLTDAIVAKPQFYMQITLGSTATTISYKIEYEMKRIPLNQISLEALRRGYTST